MLWPMVGHDEGRPEVDCRMGSCCDRDAQKDLRYDNIPYVVCWPGTILSVIVIPSCTAAANDYWRTQTVKWASSSGIQRLARKRSVADYQTHSLSAGRDSVEIGVELVKVRP